MNKIRKKPGTNQKRRWHCVECGAGREQFKTKQAWVLHRKWKHPYSYENRHNWDYLLNKIKA